MKTALWFVAEIIAFVLGTALLITTVGRTYAFALAHTGLGRFYRHFGNVQRPDAARDDYVRIQERQIRRVEEVAEYFGRTSSDPAFGALAVWRERLSDDLLDVCQLAREGLAERRPFYRPRED